MARLLRSKQGCWTCRLRKKKCDETHPECLTCKSLSITCYGYGPKPDWMDSGELERAVVSDMKETIKYTSRHKTNVHLSTRLKRAVRLAPKVSDKITKDSISSPESSHLQGTGTLWSDHGSSPSGASIVVNGQADTPPAKNSHHLRASTPYSMSAQESILLMHFLDNVLSLQYPLYKPDILEGGRGWLLDLLLRTKPLYHAALALSSYHRRMIIFERTQHQCAVAATMQQEKHLGICLAEVRQAMKSVNKFVQENKPCHNNETGTVTSIVQLVFFELFAGQGNAWQIHLQAAINMYDQACKNGINRFALGSESGNVLCHGLAPSTGDAAIIQEVAISRFLGAVVPWLDIIASITTGNAPKLLSYHDDAIAPNSQTKLEHVMGCRNWAMFQIGRIAALHTHRSRDKLPVQLSHTEIERLVNDISQEIECGLAREALQGTNISEGVLPEPHTRPGQIAFVTRIYAHMATIYLHLVHHGFQDLQLLDTTICSVMRMLQTQTPLQLLPGLVAPLFVVGCVARQGDEQQFFRSMFLSPPLLEPFLKHREKIMPILEELWRKRQTTANLTWDTVLDHSRHLLLL
ncbi:fungal-specific transcription factor domain-containing protein [Xylariaceae sp. FL1651]|nr:fungal-specific transcription factor domain-containing protein [Xylariaceae sp. FL1651]